MKYFLTSSIVIALTVLGTVHAASLGTMENYLERWCSDIDPLRSCGTYQDELESAHEKLSILSNLLSRYDSARRDSIVEHLYERVVDLYDSTSHTETKILAAYYALMLDQMRYRFDDDDIFGFLLDTGAWSRTSKTTTTYYPSRTTTYSNTHGRLQTFSAIDGRTRMDVADREIQVSGRTMELRITAVDDDGDRATLARGYRVIAEIDGRTYAASYDNGVWEFRFGDTIRNGDTITFMLLCKSCTSGRRYSSSTALDGRYVVDTEEFDILGSLSSGYNYYNNTTSRYTSYTYDLAIRHVAWDYDFSGTEATIELVTTVRNEGRYDIDLEKLRYTIEVANRVLAGYKYDIYHIETDCDDKTVSRYDDEDIRIDRGDECEITVEIRLDRHEIEDEYVEIEVAIEVDRDDRISNDTEIVRFRVD